MRTYPAGVLAMTIPTVLKKGTTPHRPRLTTLGVSGLSPALARQPRVATMQTSLDPTTKRQLVLTID
jgi:hypothetical protein